MSRFSLEWQIRIRTRQIERWRAFFMTMPQNEMTGEDMLIRAGTDGSLSRIYREIDALTAELIKEDGR